MNTQINSQNIFKGIESILSLESKEDLLLTATSNLL